MPSSSRPSAAPVHRGSAAPSPGNQGLLMRRRGAYEPLLWFGYRHKSRIGGVRAVKTLSASILTPPGPYPCIAMRRLLPSPLLPPAENAREREKTEEAAAVAHCVRTERAKDHRSLDAFVLCLFACLLGAKALPSFLSDCRLSTIHAFSILRLGG